MVAAVGEGEEEDVRVSQEALVRRNAEKLNGSPLLVIDKVWGAGSVPPSYLKMSVGALVSMVGSDGAMVIFRVAVAWLPMVTVPSGPWRLTLPGKTYVPGA